MSEFPSEQFMPAVPVLMAPSPATETGATSRLPHS